MVECIICLEELEDDICVLSCNHRYHYNCIQQWSNKINNFSNLCCICEKRCEIVNIINNRNNSKTELLNINKKKICCNIL